MANDDADDAVAVVVASRSYLFVDARRASACLPSEAGL